MSKNALRERALRSRRSLTADEIGSLSESVMRLLQGLPEYSKAKTIATYVAKGDEVQTKGIIEDALAHGKKVLVPRAVPTTTELVFAEIRSLSDLSPGHFGVLEPHGSLAQVPLERAEMVLVPVVAWDDKGHRIGYGKGYFDRALSMSPELFSVGLALESLRYDEVPSTSSDASLRAVVTERRVLRFGRSDP